MRTWHPVGLAAIAALLLAPATLAVDTDGDGADDSVDNCIDRANDTQTDTDGDGCGNACDGDYDQTGSVGASDWSAFRGCVQLLQNGPPFQNCPWADYDGNGNGGDLNDFSHFRLLSARRVPGPSAVSTDPVACP